MQTISELLDLLFKKRNITDVDSFLHPPHPATISLESLGFKKEAETLFPILETVKHNGETIVIYTDYDTDGITGGAVMWETLHHLGFKVFPYVPHRQTEGYGFSQKGIDAAIEKYHPSLFISVDHGISARKEISYIAKKGIQVVVTDHHTKPPDLPDSASVIIHCPLVSGSGLAYVVAHEIALHFGMEHALMRKLFHIDLLALASFGIIADLVPLVGPARAIAYHGLAAISTSSKPGIRALLKTAGLDGTVSAYHVGFAIAPRINAVGRLSHAIEALRMLCTTNDIKAQELAMSASHFNTSRQEMVEKAVKTAMGNIHADRLPRILIVENDMWNEGIIGLIASKLVEKWSLPAIVLTKAEGGWKGSARSVSGFDVTAFLRSLGVLEHVGGHPQAAGFSLKDTQKELFIQTVDTAAKLLPAFAPKEQRIDAEIPLELVSLQLAEGLSLWEPFGIGNPKPVFQSKAQIKKMDFVGKTKSHLKLQLTPPGTDQHVVEMMMFNPTEEQKTQIKTGLTLSCIYTVELNEWRGNRKATGHLKMIV
jgi:single-stranded-DNA-specific exonuclease